MNKYVLSLFKSLSFGAAFLAMDIAEANCKHGHRDPNQCRRCSGKRANFEAQIATLSREEQQWLWWAAAERMVQLGYDVHVGYRGFWVIDYRLPEEYSCLDDHDLQQALQEHYVAPNVQRLRERLNSMIYDVESAQWAINFLTRLVTAQDNRFYVGRGLGLSIYHYDDSQTARDTILADIRRLVQTNEDAKAVERTISDRLTFVGWNFARGGSRYPTTNPIYGDHVPPSTPEHLRDVEKLCRRIAGFPIRNREEAMVFVPLLQLYSFHIHELIWLDPYTRKFNNYLCCGAAATGFSENEYDEYSDDDDNFDTDSSTQPKQFTLSNDIEESGSILSQMSKEEFTAACIPLWLELSKQMTIDPTWDLAQDILSLLNPNSPLSDKKSLKKSLMQENSPLRQWVLDHPVLCKALFDVALPRLEGHFRRQIGSQNAIIQGQNNPILDYNPPNIDGWVVSFSHGRSIIVTPEGNFILVTQVVTPEGNIVQGNQPVLVDYFGNVYPIIGTNTGKIPTFVRLPNEGKEEETNEGKEKGTKVFTLDKNWHLGVYDEISGKNFSNATDAATYLITILCRDFYVESLVNIFVDALQPLTEPAFEFLFGEGEHFNPLFMDFLSRCQEVGDPQITGKLVHFLLDLLTSNTFQSESLELEVLLNLLETHKSTPRFSTKAIDVFEYCKEHLLQLQSMNISFRAIVPFLETLGDCVFAEKLLKVYVEGEISKALGLSVHRSLKDIYHCRKILGESVLFDDVFLQYFRADISFCLDLVQFVLTCGHEYLNFIKNTLLHALKGDKKGEDNPSLVLFLSAFEDEDDDVLMLFRQPIEFIIDFALRRKVCPNTYENYASNGASLMDTIQRDCRIDFWDDDERENYEGVNNSILNVLNLLYWQYPSVFPFLGTIIEKLPASMVFDIFSYILYGRHMLSLPTDGD